MGNFRTDDAKTGGGKSAFYALVQGRVQGVGFRYSALREAERLKLSGWVRNSADGDVEIWAEGPPETLDLFFAWLRKGPPYARVDSVSHERKEPRGYKGFNVTG